MDARNISGKVLWPEEHFRIAPIDKCRLQNRSAGGLLFFDLNNSHLFPEMQENSELRKVIFDPNIIIISILLHVERGED